MRIPVTTILLLLLALTVNAQKMAWDAQLFTGRFISHKEKRTAEEKTQYGVTINFFKYTGGKKYWQFAHGYPQMGLSFTYRNLGNDAVYGHAFSLLPYLEFNAVKSKTGTLQVKHGTGLAYMTKAYNAVANPQNTLIGSRLVATSILDIGYRLYLNKSWDAKAGVLLHHYSNGAFKLPNLGMNTASVYAGLSYAPQRKPETLVQHTPVTGFKKWRYRLGSAVGWYGYNADAGSVNTNVQLNSMAFYQHNSRFRTGAGIELNNITQSRVPAAIYAEEEVQFANITTRYGFGGYIAGKPKPGQDFYSKIGLAYYPKTNNKIPGNFYIGSMLKAHGTIAAHIELTAGYVF